MSTTGRPMARILPYALAFFASLCIMTLELVASRLVSMSFIPLLGYVLLKPSPRAEPSMEEQRSSGFARYYYAVVGAAIRRRWLVLGGAVALLAMGVYSARGLKEDAMGRSVSYPSGAIVAFTVLEVENDDDWEFEYEWLREDLRERAARAFPSLISHDGWRGQEDRILMRNAYADFGLSVYGGLVAVWIVERDDGAYWDAD